MASTSSASSESFQGLEGEALTQLLAQIRELASGGGADYKAQRAKRDAEIVSAKQLQNTYSKDAAFSDAAQLMAQNLRQSLEKNMPAISRSVQGAGTSASAMQGLLSQKLATESAQAAAAEGAMQARAYGGISSQLAGVLEGLTRIDNTNVGNLLKALDSARIQRSTSQQSSSVTDAPQSSSSGSAAGGSRYPASSGGTAVGNTNPFYTPPASGSYYAPAAAAVGGGSFSWTPSASAPADEPFFYDDWGTGSTASGDMAANPSASWQGYGSTEWDTASNANSYSYEPSAPMGWEDFVVSQDQSGFDW